MLRCYAALNRRLRHRIRTPVRNIFTLEAAEHLPIDARPCPPVEEDPKGDEFLTDGNFCLIICADRAYNGRQEP